MDEAKRALSSEAMIRDTAHATRFAAIAVALIFLANCGGGGSSPSQNPTPTPSGPPPLLALDLAVSGLTSPLDLETPDDGSGRLFVHCCFLPFLY